MGNNFISKYLDTFFWCSRFLGIDGPMHSISAIKIVSIRAAVRNTTDRIFIFKQPENHSGCVDKSALTPVDCLSLFVFSSSLYSFTQKSQNYITGNFFLRDNSTRAYH